ncbi:MAG: (p)ppGpp synthetase, partial [Actinomycetota bacterium]
MSWAVPQYRRDQVNRASQVLVSTALSEEQAEEAFNIIGNWRSSHSFPLNTFKIGLLKKAREVDQHSLVAQRLKRLSSIALKLQRFPDMRLSQMQDIAGCRAILSSVSKV